IFAASATRQMVFGLVLGILAAIGIALFIARRVSVAVGQVGRSVEELRTQALAGLSRAAEAISRGDLTVTVDLRMQELAVESNDEIGQMARGVNAMIAQTREVFASSVKARAALVALTGETSRLNAATGAGRLGERGDVEKFQGAYRELIRGINTTIDQVVTPVNEAAAVLDRLANKDLSARVTSRCEGDHATIKTAPIARAEHPAQAGPRSAWAARPV